MDREFQMEWAKLQDEALRAIRTGAAEKEPASRVVHFVTLPSFEPSESLDLLVSRRGGDKRTYRLVRTRWRIDQDMAKLATPMERLRHPRPLTPTLEREVYSLSADRVEAIVKRLRTIVVPVSVQPATAGCDGIFFEISMGEGFTEMTLRWWHEPPLGWEPLATAFHEIVAELNREFATS